MHPRVEAFRDVRVRQALNWATDRDQLQRVTGGEASAWGAPFPKDMLAGARTFQPYTLDLGPRPQPARRGRVAEGAPATLWVSDSPEPQVGAVLQQQWKAIGVDITLKQASLRDHQRPQHQGQVRLVGLDLLRDLPDGDRPDQPVLGDRRVGELHALLERRRRPAHGTGPRHDRPGRAKRAPRPGRGQGRRRRGRRLLRERELDHGPQPRPPPELPLLRCLRRLLRPSLGQRRKAPRGHVAAADVHRSGLGILGAGRAARRCSRRSSATPTRRPSTA